MVEDGIHTETPRYMPGNQARFWKKDNNRRTLMAYAGKEQHGLLWYHSHKNTDRQKDLE